MGQAEELPPAKKRVLDRLDKIIQEGDGYGTLRVEVQARRISLIKREHSEEVKKDLT